MILDNYYSKTEKRILLVLFVLITIYLIFRAIYVPILHDEASIFFINIQHGEFLPLFSEWEAGNHFLNSALSFIFTNVFGESAFTLRLASLLFIPVLFYYLYRITGLMKSAKLRWISFLCIVCSQYFIEFFAFSRGYGMAIALLFGGMYFVLKFLKTRSAKTLIACLFLLGLATFSNLTLLLCFTLIVLYLIVFIVTDRSGHKKGIPLLACVVFGVLPVVAFGVLGKVMNQLGLLYYGSQEHFWDTSINSLLKALLNADHVLTQIILLALIIWTVGLLIWRLTKVKKSFLVQVETMFPILLGALVVSIFFMTYLFGSNYPMDRTGLYLFPLFVLSFTFLSDSFARKWIQLPSLILLVLPVLFFLNLNVSYSSFWKWEQIEDDAYATILKESKQMESLPTVGVYRTSGSNWAFKNYLNGGLLSMVDTDQYPEDYCDFQIVYRPALLEWLEDYTELAYYESSQLSLLKRNQFLKRELISTTPMNIVLNPRIRGMGFPLGGNDLDPNGAYYVEFNLNIWSNGSISRALIGVEGAIEKDLATIPHKVKLNTLKKHWNGEVCKTGFLLQKIPENGINLNAFVDNHLLDDNTKINGDIRLYKVLK